MAQPESQGAARTSPNSGYDPEAGTTPDAPHVSKPGTMDALLTSLSDLLPLTPRVS